MTPAVLLHALIRRHADCAPDATALEAGDRVLDYAHLAQALDRFAGGLIALNLERLGRVAVYLEKRPETVVALFGAAAAGAVAVPVNPALRPAQVAHILRDCAVSHLVTSAARLAALLPELANCPAVKHVIVTDPPAPVEKGSHWLAQAWDSMAAAPAAAAHRTIDADMAAIFYTSGSTGRPKGVVVSHRNLVAGAQSVAAYLENTAADALLAALPLSFDAGFSQLTTAFHAGARVALLNYLMPQDVLNAIDRHRITGLTAVPPLYIQLARLDWPAGAAQSLRYFANTGGHMPRETLGALRRRLPRAKPYLMYGLTEAFRSTYLPPEEVDRRPDSIGRAIPNAEVLVLRPDGSPCAAGEAGELVHRGALVALGYWNDPQTTAGRFRPLPEAAGRRPAGLPLPELAVFSGDTVRADADGFLYFVGRQDDMIKTSGYRVSPTEIEETIYASGLVAECAAFGVPDPVLGQAIAVAVLPDPAGGFDTDALLAFCRSRFPAFMMPAHTAVRDTPLPRNPNGKIDRRALAVAFCRADGA